MRHLIRQPALLAQLGSTEKLAEENRRSVTVAVAPTKLQLHHHQCAETKGGAALMYRNPMGKKMASGGTASSRADGIAQRGKTRGRMC